MWQFLIYDINGNIVPKEETRIEETYNTHKYSLVVTSIYCVFDGYTITQNEYVNNIIDLVEI